MGAEEQDFLQSDFPMYAAMGVLTFFLYRAFVVVNMGSVMRFQSLLALHLVGVLQIVVRMEDILRRGTSSLESRAEHTPVQPEWMTKGVFPAAFMTFVGSLACHEMLLDMMVYPGGLTAWMPGVVTVLVALWASYRGQRAASGGEVGTASLAAVVAIATGAVSWLISDGEEPPQEHTKSQMRKAAREAAKAAKEAAKRAAMGIVDIPKPRKLFLEKGKDMVSEHLHTALAVLLVVMLALGVVNGPGVFPRNLRDGSFPACFMMVSGVMAYNSFLRQARSYEGGQIEDFFPAFGITLVAACVARWGYNMQTRANATVA